VDVGAVLAPPVFSSFLRGLCVEVYFCNAGKALTQRTQRKEEKTGDREKDDFNGK
jgi:hypothetical protein